jgi:hypothetical protein
MTRTGEIDSPFGDERDAKFSLLKGTIERRTVTGIIHNF